MVGSDERRLNTGVYQSAASFITQPPQGQTANMAFSRSAADSAAMDVVLRPASRSSSMDEDGAGTTLGQHRSPIRKHARIPSSSSLSEITESTRSSSLQASPIILPAPLSSLTQARRDKEHSASFASVTKPSHSPTSSLEADRNDLGMLSLVNRRPVLSESLSSSSRLPGLAEFYPHDLWRQRSRAETASSSSSSTIPQSPSPSGPCLSSSSSGFSFNDSFGKSKPQLVRSHSFKNHTAHSISSLMSPSISSPATTQSHASPKLAASGQVRVTAYPSSRKAGKTQVSNACLNCKKSHLACDISRPCRRCVNLGKTNTCVDVEPKKRGRPPLKPREEVDVAKSAATSMSELHLNFPRVAPANTSGEPSGSSVGWRPSFGSEAGFHSPPMSKSNDYDSGHHSTALGSAAFYPGSRRRSVSAAAAMQLHTMRSVPSAPPLTPRHEPVVSIIAGTDMRIGRASDEVHAMLGAYPIELQNRSLFDLVHAQDQEALETLLFSLIKPVGIQLQPIPAHMNVVHNTPPARLLLPAAGTIFVHHNLRVRMRDGAHEYCSVRLHLGGGFGAELFRSETSRSAYIVASLHRFIERGDLHPDPSVLRTARFDPTQDPRAFSTPVKKESHQHHRRDNSGSSSTSSHLPLRYAHADSGTSSLSPALSAMRWNNADSARSEMAPERSPPQEQRHSPNLSSVKRGFPLPERSIDPHDDSDRPHKMPALPHRRTEPLPPLTRGPTSPPFRTDAPFPRS